MLNTKPSGVATAAMFVLMLPWLGATTQVRAQPPLSTLSCNASIHKEFDFWIGEWDIVQTIYLADGTTKSFPARTVVTKSPDGCVITENWSGSAELFWYGMASPESFWGYSVRRVDPATGKWMINWIDAKSPQFGPPFVGGFQGDVGVFIQDNGDRKGRIRFIRKAGGNVDWELHTSSDGGTTWRPLWTMTMSPAPRKNR